MKVRTGVFGGLACYWLFPFLVGAVIGTQSQGAVNSSFFDTIMTAFFVALFYIPRPVLIYLICELLMTGIGISAVADFVLGLKTKRIKIKMLILMSLVLGLVLVVWCFIFVSSLVWAMVLALFLVFPMFCFLFAAKLIKKTIQT